MKITLGQPYSFCQKGQRGNQEDARYPDNDKPSALTRTFVVCDGVGGLEKGEVASRTVADAIGTYMQRVDCSQEFTSAELTLVLDRAFRALNRVMDEDTREMATTLTFLCVNGGGVMAAHIGDSRIYQVRPGTGILYQSEDHSLVNSLVHSGVITPQEAIDHPRKNVITRCIGYVAPGEERPTATTMQIKDVEPGDYFFMCTDGVLDRVSDKMLIEILSSAESDEWKIKGLARLSRDSSDNNTAYLIRIESVHQDEEVIDDSADTAVAPEPAEVQYESHDTEKIPIADSRNGRYPEEVEEVQASGSSFKSKIGSFFKKIFR